MSQYNEQTPRPENPEPDPRWQPAARSATGTASTLPAPAPPDVEEEAESLSFAGKREEPEMDVTPMVDVVFQLLIFFMITASFSLQKSLQLPKPQDDKPSSNVVPQDPENETESVTVYVDANNTYRVETGDWEEEAPSEQDLIIKLKRARAGDGSGGKPPTKMIVKAHGDALHGKVVAAVDAATAVGMEQVQLKTVETDDE
jgi:biopolymer transport protein ExbD